MSYMLSLQNMYPFRDSLRYFKKVTFFIVKLKLKNVSGPQTIREIQHYYRLLSLERALGYGV